VRPVRITFVLAALAIATSAAPALGQSDGPVTPAGWRVQPAGEEFGVSQLASGFQGPLAEALTPDGEHLLTSSAGAARFDSVDLFDLRAHARQDALQYDADKGQAAYNGMVVAPDGQHAWASGGGEDVVHVLSLAGGRLSETGQIATPFFPAGMAYGRTALGDRIYVANNLSAHASNAAGNPAGRQVTVIDPATNKVTGTIDLGANLEPVAVAFDRGGDKAYVTEWMGRSVAVIDTRTQTLLRRIELSPPGDPLQADHPVAITANPARDEMYVSNAASDTVSVIDNATDSVAGTIDVALVHGGPKGANPQGLDVTPDGSQLFVALAGENAVAAVDLDRRSVDGFIPTSWHPSDVKVTPDGARLVVLNTNDSGAGPNPCGPLSPRTDCPPKDPNRDEPSRGSIDPQYSGSMIKGSVQVVDLVRAERRLARLSQRVRRNNQADERARPKPEGLGAIKHVIYVIKENRTYDQVLGDLPRGNGDPSLTLFGSGVTPNQHELARRFSLIDNFYADAEVSADGHNWATQANAPDYVDRTWPVNYSPSPRSDQRAYDFEDLPFSQQFPTEPLAGDVSVPRSPAAQPVGYLWDDAFRRGVSYRGYGEFTQFPGDCKGTNQNISHTTHLAARFGDHVDTAYPGYNLGCSDHTTREPEFAREFRHYVRTGALPALSVLRLSSDHTSGARAGSATPQAYVADNDLAVGRLVDLVSHSRYWRSTAILITEDDAQNGPDHIDAHRTVALAVSPYTQKGRVDSTHYDTASMLATVEGLLGLPPMSITDARVSRMWASFSSRPDFRPYTASEPGVTPFGDPGAPTNPGGTVMATAASRMDLSRPDAAPEVALDRAIWRTVRGPRSRMPAPRHKHIIGSRPTDG